jgi:hypothetical protein
MTIRTPAEPGFASANARYLQNNDIQPRLSVTRSLVCTFINLTIFKIYKWLSP